MSKTVKHGAEARDAILRGVNFIVDAVALTEGPRGRTAILGQRQLGQTPRVSRDGVSVANYVDCSDPTEQLGSDLIREASQKTDSSIGDGTSATAILARAMIQSGFDFIKNGANPMAIERGVRKAVDVVISEIDHVSIPTDNLKIFQVATVSAHGDVEIGKLVADAIIKAGPDGVVTSELSSTSDTYVDSVAGLELPKSNLVHGSFITNPETMSAEWTDCRILLWEGVIGSAKSLVPILSQVKDAGTTPLLIIAGGYEAEALAVIINNRIRAALPVVAVRLEAYGERKKELLRDIAALTGGTAYTEDMGKKIETVKLAELGQAQKVVVNMTKTQILGGRGNQAELVGRVDSIKSAMTTAAPLEKSILQTRLAALLGGISIIKVGGSTITEAEEKRDRVTDALSAAKAAVKSGIVAGGGHALMQASVAIHGLKLTADEKLGALVVHKACHEILKQLASNAGVSSESVLSRATATANLGYNVVTDTFEDLIQTGIIDPAAVVIEALRNASAVSCSILTMGCTVSELPKEHSNV
jgi:chaperonin GroEL